MKKGFTLIELIVAVTIIVVLVSVATIAYQQTIITARDSRRLSDLKKLRDAMEIFKSQNNRYPTFTGGSHGWATVNNLVGLAPTFIDSIPSDPSSGNGCPGYLLSNSSDFQNYTIMTRLENTTSPEASGVKPAPRSPPPGPAGGNTDNITFVVETGTCDKYQYNYWINNP